MERSFGARGPFAPEIRQFADPITEFPVFRLTDPKLEDCRLPAVYNRAIGRKGTFVVYSRGGDSVCRVDVKTGLSSQVADAPGIDHRTLAMTPDERLLFWIEDGVRVVQCGIGGGRKRTVYTSPAGWSMRAGLSVSEDGLFAAAVESKDAAHRVRLIATVRGNATTVVDSPDAPLRDAVIRPKRAGFVYRKHGNELWLGSFDASRTYKLKTPVGELASPQWGSDGRTVQYLLKAEGARLPAVRECVPDSNEDRLIAPTSQFASVGRNGDASVYVGASASKASPAVLLLLKTTKREFTLAEHKASDPAEVTPVFSPNSQRVFFQTDRDGKWALYYMQVDKLVEETDH